MFGFKTKDRKDPAEIAKEFAKENKIDLIDENPTQEGSETSADEKPADSDENTDDKSSQEEDETQKGGKQDEDKDDQLTEEEQKLVDTDDDELDEENKTKKQNIVNKKRDTGAEKRINDLVSKVKEMEERQAKQEQEYQNRLAEIELERKVLEEKVNGPSKSSVEETLKKQENDRIAKYLQEDQGLPREQRREMTKDEIDEWMVEDIAEATEWVHARYDRRKQERAEDIKNVQLDAKIAEIERGKQISRVRFEARHPDIKLSTLKARQAELMAEGKTEKEADAIMAEENPKVRVFMEVAKDKAFLEEISIYPDAPERIEKEILKRLNGKPSSDTDDLKSRIAELEDLVKAKELKGDPVGTGVGSRLKGGSNMRNEEKHNPALEAELAKINKAGYKITAKDHADMIERRKSIPGSGVYDHGK